MAIDDLCNECREWFGTSKVGPHTHCHHPKEVQPSRIRAGMRVRIRDGAMIGQDMGFHKWIDDGTLFLVQNFNASRKRLTAPGYGHPTPDYGNGAIYANDEDLILTEEVQPCRWCEAWKAYCQKGVSPNVWPAVNYLITRGKEPNAYCPECGAKLP